MFKFFLCSTLLLFGKAACCQQVSISGTVRDVRTSETLSNVNLVLLGTPLGTSTDSTGFYEIKVSSGHYTLVATALVKKTS